MKKTLQVKEAYVFIGVTASLPIVISRGPLSLSCRGRERERIGHTKDGTANCKPIMNENPEEVAMGLTASCHDDLTSYPLQTKNY